MTGHSGFIAARLDGEIERLCLTNEEFAHVIGVPERSLRRWRKGQATPRRKTVRRIAAQLERDPAWFYADHSSEEPVS